MPAIFERRIVVGPDAIDAQHHVNNLAYLRWMQEVATAHSAEQGWSMERYFATGTSWVVRSHFIEYRRPAFEGEVVLARTWIRDVERRRSTRCYAFSREGDGALLARAETLWVFVELASGRPADIPDALRADFPLVPDDSPLLAGLGLGPALTPAR